MPSPSKATVLLSSFGVLLSPITTSISSFFEKMINKIASQSMVGDMSKYQQVSMVEGMTSGKMNGGNVASDMVAMQMGMSMGQQMMNNMQQNSNTTTNNNTQDSSNGAYPKFCPSCGTKTSGGKFCSECGQKLS